MTVDAIVRARMGSTRLPNKTLLEVGGKSMLAVTVERLGRAERIDRIVVATSTDPADDAIVQAAEALGSGVFRGSPDDVLGRVVACAEQFGMSDVAHFSPDNPLIDPALCDEMVAVYEEGHYDYVTNNLPPTWPDGMEVEVTSLSALRRSETHADEPAEREHFLTWIWGHQDQFRIRSLTREPSLNGIRVTLDYPEDWEVISGVLEHFGASDFSWQDVVDFLAANPALAELNAAHAGHYPWRDE
jgi:spore coat polysaccharide biosynthesis protein SpsF (cytidylyltransferase family)